MVDVRSKVGQLVDQASVVVAVRCAAETFGVSLCHTTSTMRKDVVHPRSQVEI